MIGNDLVWFKILGEGGVLRESFSGFKFWDDIHIYLRSDCQLRPWYPVTERGVKSKAICVVILNWI